VHDRENIAAASETFWAESSLMLMTKKFWNYVISVFSFMGTLWIIDDVCVLLGKMPHANLIQLTHLR
jgi:hypothetical protein